MRDERMPNNGVHRPLLRHHLADTRPGRAPLLIGISPHPIYTLPRVLGQNFCQGTRLHPGDRQQCELLHNVDQHSSIGLGFNGKAPQKMKSDALITPIARREWKTVCVSNIGWWEPRWWHSQV